MSDDIKEKWGEFFYDLKKASEPRTGSVWLFMAQNPDVVSVVMAWQATFVTWDPKGVPPTDPARAWDKAWQVHDDDWLVQTMWAASGLSISNILAALKLAKAQRLIFPDGTVLPAADNWIKLEAKSLAAKRSGQQKTGQKKQEKGDEKD